MNTSISVILNLSILLFARRTSLAKNVQSLYEKRASLAKALSPFAIIALILFSADALAVDYMADLGTSVGSGATLLFNLLKIFIIIIMVGAVLYKFAEAARGRASYPEAIVPVIAGSVLLGFVALVEVQLTTDIAAL